MISTTLLRRTLVFTLQTVISTLIQLVKSKWLEGTRKQTFWKVGPKRMKCLIFNCRCLKRHKLERQRTLSEESWSWPLLWIETHVLMTLSPSKRNKNISSPEADMSLLIPIQCTSSCHLECFVFWGFLRSHATYQQRATWYIPKIHGKSLRTQTPIDARALTWGLYRFCFVFWVGWGWGQGQPDGVWWRVSRIVTVLLAFSMVYDYISVCPFFLRSACLGY